MPCWINNCMRMMEHPMHLHTHPFAITSFSGQPLFRPLIKDMVNPRPRERYTHFWVTIQGIGFATVTVYSIYGVDWLRLSNMLPIQSLTPTSGCRMNGKREKKRIPIIGGFLELMGLRICYRFELDPSEEYLCRREIPHSIERSGKPMLVLCFARVRQLQALSKRMCG